MELIVRLYGGGDSSHLGAAEKIFIQGIQMFQVLCGHGSDTKLQRQGLKPAQELIHVLDVLLVDGRHECAAGRNDLNQLLLV